METIHKEKILAIINGNGLKNSRIEKLKSFFKEQNIDAEIFYSKNQIKGLLENTESYTGFFTLGGDGTIHETINNIDNSKQWLAFFPGGTVNVIPRYFKMKINENYIQSFISNHDNQQSDILKVQFVSSSGTIEKYVMGFITVGHLANMTLLADKLRWLPRFFRYPVAGFLHCFYVKTIRASFNSDFEDISDKKITSLLINNCAAEIFSYLKNWNYRDGKFEYKIEKNNIFSQYFSMINRYLKIPFKDNWKRDNTFLKIKFQKPTTVMADGELFRNVLGLNIEILKSKQKIKIPL